jgi:antitoxin MazE
MEARVKKWGNSLGIRIPKSIADDIGLKDNCLVELLSNDCQLVIRPKSKAYTLEELLAQIKRKNIQHETDWGKPVGAETW